MKKGLLFLLAGFLTNIAFADNLEKSKWDLSKDKVLYTVGYAHLDTQWRWDYQKTINDYIKATLEDNFKYLEQYPEYVFNFTGSTRYEMMKEYYPDDYSKLKEYINQGRWFVSGSSVDEGDALAPSVESLIRQVLLGNEYFRKEFGKTSCDYMLPDCFGFMAHTPSVWAHCGILGFSTQKLTWGSAVGIPFNIGTWQGPDGKSIICAFNPGVYNRGIKDKADSNEQWAKRINENGEKYQVYADYHYYGTGDMGGAPKESYIKNYTDCVKTDNGKYKIFLTSSDQFYKDITGEERAKLPRYKGDLLLTEHSAGSITSQAFMKRLNRKNEQLADSAERAAVTAYWLGGIEYPCDKFDAAWKRVLSNQFHDILPGTCLPRAYEFSWNDDIIALNMFAASLNDSVGAISSQLDTNVNGRAIVVYNPLAIAREDISQATLEYPNGCPKNVEVVGPDGKIVPSQIVSANNHKLEILFLANVPANGFAVYDIRESKSKNSIENELAVTENTLENKFYKVRIDKAGDIESIFDKQAKKELLESPAKLAFLYEKPKRYPAWNMDWDDQKQQPQGYVDGKAKIEIIEKGPVRVCIAVTRESRNSLFTQYISLGSGDAGGIIEINNKIEWQTSGYALKAVFPLTVSNQNATYNLGLGTIERANNNEKKYEVPSHEWFDLTDAKSDYGVSIMEDCKYGSDKPADNIVRLTLLYSPDTEGRKDFMEQKWQDWGIHNFKYAIYGHTGNWRQGFPEWRARRLNQPLVAFESPAHSGNLNKSYSFAWLNSNQVDIRAIKKAEREDAVIIRVQELTGKEAKNVQVAIANGIDSAYEVNGQEYKIGDASLIDSKLKFDIEPYGIRSFAFKLKSPAKKMSKPDFAAVNLDYNTDVISSDRNRTDGTMAQNYSYSAELMPDVITSESIQFKIGPKADGMKNAVICKGQKINLPQGKYNRLYILAAADEDTQGIFEMGSQKSCLDIQKWTGFIGQWDNRVFDKDFGDVDFEGTFKLKSITPGFIKRDSIAWFGKHRHSVNGNDPYWFTYIFKYALDIPEGSKTLVLPKNEKIKVFAITAANNKNDPVKNACSLYDDFEGRNKINLKCGS